MVNEPHSGTYFVGEKSNQEKLCIKGRGEGVKKTGAPPSTLERLERSVCVMM